VTQWWRDAVVYQVYIRSFADGNGDATGDLAGLRNRLPYLAGLGVDAIWVNPWYPSPLNDGGYDVADYRAIHPMFGTLAEAEALIEEAHALGIRLIADIVPNHTSDQHEWFQAAVQSAPGSPQRERYWFRDGRGPGGDEPPNDWRSIFGGSAWQRITEPDGAPGQYYLHLFDHTQPDLNWSNPDVVTEFQSILRFWFDRGVDGFRIDVGHGLAKDPTLPDLGVDDEGLLEVPDRSSHPHWDRDEVHEVYRGWRAVADSYDPPRMFVGEVWLDDPARLARYLRPDELHTSFAFELTDPDWDAAGLRSAITSGVRAAQTAGVAPTWTLSPVKAREGFGESTYDMTGLDLERGRSRARAAVLLLLGLPGSAYLYQGEELGLEEVMDIPDHLRDDPVFLRRPGVDVGRDGCRVPLPWTSDGESLGFGANGAWLPQPAHWADLAVSVQDGDDDSMLELYRRALAVRRAEPSLHTIDMEWVDSPPQVLHWRRPHPDGSLDVVVTMGEDPYRLPAGKVVVASHPLANGLLPGGAGAWVRVS
jgi:alpha-glucosidase